MSVWVKVCGVTSPEDAELCANAGADAVGLNFVSGSPRRLEPERARAIIEVCRGRLEVVGVIADWPRQEARRLLDELGLDRLQLHGHESPEELEALLPFAYKAVRVADASDVLSARRYAGDRLLVDAKVEGVLGGTGHRLDPELVRELSRERPLILAGGLRPDNVGGAIRAVRPWGVDVASGVELDGSPREKSEARVRAFVVEARAAAED